MALNAIYDNLDDIPENFRELYTERDGKHELTGVTGIKTQADIDRIQAGLVLERDAHKETREKLSAFGTLNPEEVHAQLDKIDEYKTMAEGKIDDEKIESIVESRIKAKMGPLERELTQAKAKLEETEGQIGSFETKDKTRSIRDEVGKAASESKVIVTAIEDVLMMGESVFEINEDGKVVTKDGVGVTPGVDAAVWLTEMKDKRPHWWPGSSGSGAAGSNNGSKFANNPFSKDHWNMTEQGKMVTQDKARAEQMAKAAGTTVGGKKPA